MRKTINIVFLAILTICFVACKKNNSVNSNTPSNVIDGSWNFNGIHSKRYVFTTNGVDTTIYTSDYKTSQNAGTVTITGNSFTGNDIGYTAVTPSLIISYQNNQPNDTLENTFTSNVISSINSSTGFETIGTDSIHFKNTGFPDSLGNNNPIVTGAKFIISGDTLTLTSDVFINKMSGPTIQYELDTLVTTMLKQ